jgi:hypothetical protein
MKMKLFEVVGYQYDGEIYCKHCFEESNRNYAEKLRQSGYSEDDIKYELEFDFYANDGIVIIAGDEWDNKPSCYNCHEVIDVTVSE